MELFGVGGSRESALDAFLTDPDLREMWFSNTDRSALHAVLEDRSKTKAGAQKPIAQEEVATEPGDGHAEPLLRVKVAIDEMAAWVILRSFSQGIDQETLESMIYEELEHAQVRYGIRRQQISRIARTPLYDKPLLVAQGRRPKEDQEGAVSFKFQTKGSLKPTTIDGYGVNPENPDFTYFVQAGALLCTISRAPEDFTGKNIRGRTIHPLNGGLNEVQVGENVRMSADGQKWYALTDGEVILNEKILSVLPVLRIDNVDVSTGDIHFHGSIYVKGNVESGRTVEATENVIVGGVVQNGIICAGGHLAVGEGIKGAEHTAIQVGGSLRTPFIEYMKVSVGGDIYANVLFGADINCQGGVYSLGRRGRIVAGKCIAREIEAVEIGNDVGAPTYVEIAGVKSLEDALFMEQQELVSWEERAGKMQRLVTETTNTARRKVLAPVLMQIEEQKKATELHIVQLQRQIDVARLTYSMEIRVEGELQPKVQYTIGGVSHYCKECLVGVRLFSEVGKLRRGAWPMD